MKRKITVKSAKWIKKYATIIKKEDGEIIYKLANYGRMVDVSIDAKTIHGKFTDFEERIPRDYYSFIEIEMSETAKEILF